MRGQVGNWVVGEEFWGRDQELLDLKDYVDRGSHVLLVAPRRVGKTSLLRELVRKHQGVFHGLYIDLEAARGPADLIVELALASRAERSLWSRVSDAARAFAGEIETLSNDDLTIKLREGIGGAWQTRGDRLLDALGQDGRRVVIVLDELPILVNRMLKGDDFNITSERRRDTDLFLSFLRAQTLKRSSNVSFIVAGSIGLEPILRQAGLSATINSFTPYELHPWDDATSCAFLTAISESSLLPLGDGVPEEMMNRLGCGIPHHVQLFFDQLRQDARRRKSATLTRSDVARVFKERMLSTRGHAELSHLEERLRLVVGAKRLPLALDLLTETSLVGALTPERALHLATMAIDDGIGARPEDLLSELVGVFEHDGYLRCTDNGHVFVSKLVREWWKARFGRFSSLRGKGQ